MTFKDWYHEIENFSLRSERFLEDFEFVLMEGSNENWNEALDKMEKWLMAAYEVGREHALLSSVDNRK